MINIFKPILSTSMRLLLLSILINPLMSGENRGKTVEEEIEFHNTLKPAIFSLDPLSERLGTAYKLKDDIYDTFGLKFNIDYSILVQHSNFTEDGDNTASSSVFRILGTWLHIGDRDGSNGKLVWKVETRNPIFGNPTPREMGFNTGSALSTANYKSMNYLGITDLYWKQRFYGGKLGFVIGHMDPGDWADQYPLLNAWTGFISDAFYNNPTEAIPKRGFGMVGQYFFPNNMYIMGGVHDANGKDGKLDFTSLWSTRELFSWAEFGYRSNLDVLSRHNVHVHLWHQDERKSAGIAESKGITYTHSIIRPKGGIAFLRAGYSEGGAAQMRRFIGIGATHKVFEHDTLGIATSWGSPPDKSLRSQVTSEVFYHIQMTQNLTFTPSLQWTYKPSFTTETNSLIIPGLRMRLVF